MSEEYEVGYKKPPKKTQFQPGRSGNPKGRPKGVRNFKTDVKDALKKPVKVTADGKAKKVSTQQAALWRLREQALKGDGKALDRLLGLANTHNNEELVEETKSLNADDAAILASYNARITRRANKGLAPLPNKSMLQSPANDAADSEVMRECGTSDERVREAAIGEALFRRAIGDPPKEGDEELLREHDIERALA